MSNASADKPHKRALNTNYGTNRWLTADIIKWLQGKHSSGEVEMPNGLPFIMDRRQVCELLGVHRDTINEWRRLDGFPEPLALAPRPKVIPPNRRKAQENTVHAAH